MLRSIFLVVLQLVLLMATAIASDLPKNTKVEVRLNQALGSDTSQTGQRFTATVSHDVTFGTGVLRKGAQVEGIVRDARSTMDYYQAGELDLELTAVTSGEKGYRITSGMLRLAGRERPRDPYTGKEDDRGARGQDTAQAAGQVIVGSSSPSHTIPGTDIAAGGFGARTGMQVLLPQNSKLTFVITGAD